MKLTSVLAAAILAATAVHALPLDKPNVNRMVHAAHQIDSIVAARDVISIQHIGEDQSSDLARRTYFAEFFSKNATKLLNIFGKKAESKVTSEVGSFKLKNIFKKKAYSASSGRLVSYQRPGGPSRAGNAPTRKRGRRGSW